MTLDPHWIAVAQVYATLAVAQASIVIGGTTEEEESRAADALIDMAKKALEAAGVTA